MTLEKGFYAINDQELQYIITEEMALWVEARYSGGDKIGVLRSILYNPQVDRDVLRCETCQYGKCQKLMRFPWIKRCSRYVEDEELRQGE